MLTIFLCISEEKKKCSIRLVDELCIFVTGKTQIQQTGKLVIRRIANRVVMIVNCQDGMDVHLKMGMGFLSKKT